MKRGTLLVVLVALCILGNAACGGNSHHTPPVIPTNNFVFYANGEDQTGNGYAIVGAVTITADGNNTITGGVQDFNDGDPTTATNPGLGTSPQPSGDTILATGSSLIMNADGSGNAVLTLVTSNTALGV